MASDIKRNLRAVMTRKGIKTGEVAEALGTETLQLSVWLSRNNGQSIEKLIQIADAIGCDLALVDRQTKEVYK